MSFEKRRLDCQTNAIARPQRQPFWYNRDHTPRRRYAAKTSYDLIGASITSNARPTDISSRLAIDTPMAGRQVADVFLIMSPPPAPIARLETLRDGSVDVW